VHGQRLQRVNDLLRRVLAEVIEERLRDPRLGFVTLTGVETSPDLRQARVYVSVLGSPEAVRTSVKILNNARHFLRNELRREVELRTLPELRFVFDTSLEHADRIDRLLREVSGSSSGGGAATGDDPEEVEE
jgi:ribosome-binding factor A